MPLKAKTMAIVTDTSDNYYPCRVIVSYENEKHIDFLDH